MQDFELKERKEIFKGRVVTLSSEKIVLPDGTEKMRDVIRHPGAAAIVPMISRDEIVLIRQFRYCTGETLWEIPAGTLEPDEKPIECAKRELIEETGYSAGKMEPLGGFYTSPGFCTEFLHLFIATELEPCESGLDDDEQLTVHRMPVEEAFDKMERGEIVDAKTIVGLLKLKEIRSKVR